jgi:anti-anti-sigma factor
MSYSLAITKAGRSAYVRVTGDVDYETADEVIEAASQLLTEQAELTDLRLDFSGLTYLDSGALSGLLLLHRRTTQSGVRLHLEHRPAFLDRVLQVTGLYGHFTASHSTAAVDDSTESSAR